MRKLLFSLIGLVVVATVLFSSCERRPLEVRAQETVNVKFTVKWKVNFVTLYGETPNGMTVMLWNSQNEPVVKTTNDDHISLQLLPDKYRMIIFNELAEEYAPYLKFYDTDNYDRMSVRATRISPSGSRSWDSDITYMYTPEDPRIAVALDSFLITDEMLMGDSMIFIPYEEYRDNGYKAERISEYVYEIPEVPWPMTVDLYVRVKVKHRNSLRQLEGNISGMADGFYLSHIIRTQETGILKLKSQEWAKTRLGEPEDSMGLLESKVASFGLPYGKELLSQRDSTDNVLTLNLTLVNDSTIQRSFNVGKHLMYITPEGDEAVIRYRQDLQNLSLVIDLPDIINLPDVTPASGAGFDAEVDDWEDGGAIDIGGF